MYHKNNPNYKEISEYLTIKDMITNKYPSGIVSIVSDSINYWTVITSIASRLKEDILNRKENALGLAKVVFRPDSGDPVEIVCGLDIKDYSKYEDIDTAAEFAYDDIMNRVRIETPHGECGKYSITEYFRFNEKAYLITVAIEWNRYDKQFYYIDGSRIDSCKEVELTPEQKGSVECLWDIFGGTTSELGYKTLNQRVGLIYGDSITQQRAFDILTRLKKKGFASNNIVFGIGSYTMQLLSRDCLGMAIKATWACVDGVGYDIYKDPITDDGMKKSAKGLLRVNKVDNNFILKDQCSMEEENGGELKIVFENGKLIKDWTLAEIRAEVAKTF